MLFHKSLLIKLKLISCLFLFTTQILGETLLNKVPLYSNLNNLNNLNDPGNSADPFFIHIDDKTEFDKWLFDTNYISTFHSLLYVFDSSNNDPVDDTVIKELAVFSKFMKDNAFNVLNKNCFDLADDQEDKDDLDNFEYLGLNNIQDNEALNSYIVDEILVCQEEIKILTFIIDAKELDIKEFMLDNSFQRLIIFPPSLSLGDYNMNKNILSNNFNFYDDNTFETDEDTQEDIDSQKINENINSKTKFESFINNSKFTIFKTKYATEEITFYEYMNLSWLHMTENYEDWKFQLWDYLAKVLLLRFNMPQTLQQQTNQFVYYFSIFFIVLIVLKKKVIPFFNKSGRKDVAIKIVCMLVSFLIILTSITGFQFVKTNSIILLAKDERTDEIVYFAGSFNWQFGIETLIISVIYIALSFMVLSIIKKSKEEDKMELEQDTKPVTKDVAIIKLLTLIIILYIIYYLSQNVLTQDIFINIKYNGNYAY